MVGNEYVDGGVMTEEEWGKPVVEKWKRSTLCAMKWGRPGEAKVVGEVVAVLPSREKVNHAAYQDRK